MAMAMAVMTVMAMPVMTVMAMAQRASPQARFCDDGLTIGQIWVKDWDINVNDWGSAATFGEILLKSHSTAFGTKVLKD